MATKKELGADLKALGVEVNIDDHSHDELTDMLRDARAAAEDVGEKIPETKTGGYIVADGVHLTYKGGILNPGDAVSEKMLSGGAAAFEALVKKGKIVK